MRGDEDDAVAGLVADAELSTEAYEIDAAHGQRELLYGVSVFSPTEEAGLVHALDRFPNANPYLRTTAGALRDAGFEVYGDRIESGPL